MGHESSDIEYLHRLVYTFIDSCVACHAKHWPKESASSNTNMNRLTQYIRPRKLCLKESLLKELAFLTEVLRQKQQGQNKY